MTKMLSRRVTGIMPPNPDDKEGLQTGNVKAYLIIVIQDA